jgi:phage FluMu gp28-like protein
VIFTMASKFTMASMLKDRMEDRRFRLPAGHRDMRDDLHSITKAVTSTGSVRLVHDGESDGHGDRFWAAALCCNAAGEAGLTYDGFRSVGRGARTERVPGYHPDDDPWSRGHGRGSRFGQGGW